MMDKEPMGVLGVSVCNKEEIWRYYIAVSSSKESEGLEAENVTDYAEALRGQFPPGIVVETLHGKMKSGNVSMW